MIWSFVILVLPIFTLTDIYFTKNKAHEKDISNFVQLTKLPNIVKSVSYVEPRFLEYDDYSYTLYPSLKVPSYMKFAYE